MRGGGRLLLILGVLVAAVAAGLLFVYLSNRQVAQVPGDTIATAVPTEDPGVNIVVAAVDIPANRVISDTTLLTTKNIKTVEYTANRNRYFTNPGEVIGKLAINAIQNGQEVTQNDITEPGLSQEIPTPEEGRPPDKGYPFRVDSETGVADQVKPGDSVDVVATFRVPRRVALPAGSGEGDQANNAPPFESIDLYSSKTLVQRALVLRIVRPPTPQEGATPEPGQPTPEPGVQPTVAVGPDGRPVTPANAGGNTGTTITAGSWILVLALNDQEAELMEFARVSEARVSLVLRGNGDAGVDQTIGASLDLLVSQFGLPEPDPEPVFVYGREVLTPLPTRTPAPTRAP